MSFTSVRKPDETRDEDQELTFKQKLEEVKKLREAGILGKGQQRPKKANKALLINGKPVSKLVGDWAKLESNTKKGKFYYFHLKTQKSTWKQPQEFNEQQTTR